MKENIQERILKDDFVMELVGSKRIISLIEKYKINVDSDLYSDVIKKSIDRLNKEL